MDIQTLFGLEGKTALVTGGATGIGRMAAEALVRLRDEGAAVLLISEDLDELFQLCGRMGAICAGRLSPLVNTSELTIERLGQWMAGDFPSAAPSEVSHAVA